MALYDRATGKGQNSGNYGFCSSPWPPQSPLSPNEKQQVPGGEAARHLF